MLRNYYAEVHRQAWSLRRITGGSLRLALKMKVPEGMRADVLKQVQWLQRKHGVTS